MTNINRALLTIIFSLGIPFQVLANTANDFGISNDNFIEISQRVNSMSLIELTTTKAQLEAEQDNLNDSIGGTQSPSENKKISERLALIGAELELIQGALIALGAVAIISTFDDDSSSSTTPVVPIDTSAPVITITGSNPATAELGSTYNDAGATAIDNTGAILPVASGTVDTDTLGTVSYTHLRAHET